MRKNSAIFNARHGAGSFHPHRQPAPTAQDCLKRGNGANWRTTRQLSGECRLKWNKKPMRVEIGSIDYNKNDDEFLLHGILETHLQAAWLLYKKLIAAPSIAESAFRTAQWLSVNSAGLSMEIMARRSSLPPEVAAKVRRLQDMKRQLDERMERALAACGVTGDSCVKAFFDIGPPADETNMVVNNIQKAAPAFYEFVYPKEITIAEAQGMISPDEVLVVFTMSGGDAFAWAIRKDRAEWKKLDLSPEEIAEAVNSLRCGLDQSQWGLGEADRERSARCLKLVGVGETPQYGDPLPFRLDVAHKLYEAMLGPFENLVKGKHLIVVSDGALATLPFQVLVTEKPSVSLATTSDDFRSVAWLGTRQPLSVLPLVSSLKALRKLSKGSAGDQPYVGFGNPLLVGPDGTDRRAFAESANSCRIAAADGAKRVEILGVRQGTGRLASRGGLANPEEVRKLPPLVATTEEVCAVAASLGASQDDIHLGREATETVVNQMNASGRLGRARVVQMLTDA